MPHLPPEESHQQDAAFVNVRVRIGGKAMSPNEITDIMGVPPTGIWRATIPDVIACETSNKINWYREVKQFRTDNLNEVVRLVLVPFFDARARLVPYCEAHGLDVLVHCAIYGASTAIVPCLSSEVIQQMAALSASFCLATYYSD